MSKWPTHHMTLKPSDAEFNAAADWYAQLARKPGWLEHCRHAVQELEADSSGLYAGLRLAVRKRIEQHRASLKDPGN